LTPFEKKQPNSVFVQAGKDAFMIMIHVMNNPYTLQPYRTLWDKGYRRAERNYHQARLAAQRKEAFGDKPPVPTVRNVQQTSDRPTTPRPGVHKPFVPFPGKQRKPVTVTTPVPTVDEFARAIGLTKEQQAVLDKRRSKPTRPKVYRPGTIGSYLGGAIPKVKQ
jgi:hypothetical protein